MPYSAFYLPHLRYYCRIIGIDSSRYSDSPHASDKGAGRTQYKSRAPPQYDSVTELNGRSRSWAMPFPVRDPLLLSCRLLVQFTVGRFGDSKGHNWGVLGIADSALSPVRVGRYRFRSESEDRVKNDAFISNINKGARLFRPYVCKGSATGPASMCPDRRLWRLLRTNRPPNCKPWY